MTKVDLNTIREELCRLAVLVDGWDDPNEISALERDLALTKLRELYDILFFAEARTAVVSEASDESYEPLSISLDEVLLAETPEAESQDESELVAPVVPVVFEPFEPPKPEVAISTLEREKPIPVRESSKASEPVLFGVDELTQHKRKQRVIMSLYGEIQADVPTPKAEITPVVEFQPDPTPAPVVETPQPVVEEQPVSEPMPEPETTREPEMKSEEEFEAVVELISVEQHTEQQIGAVLGEVINRGVQTLGETLAQSRNTVSEVAHLSPIDDLRTAIGINDRFLLVRDLFDGNAVACDTLIEKLNSFDNLDDCMIYLAEHYTWNPNSDGAKLLVELLERKLD